MNLEAFGIVILITFMAIGIVMLAIANEHKDK